MSIEVKDLSYIYDPGTPLAKEALSHINLSIEKGEFIGLIGHTGSGKSTLIQHLNGLLEPTEGKLLFEGEDIYDIGEVRKKKQRRLLRQERMKKLRQKVGLVFQYPEHQLFEVSVEKDIAFGPTNMGLDKEAIQRRVEQAMQMVGLDESYKEKSPFELSGGQKRRVAIAGILAMQPDYLILDEPTAGLDPKGRDDILSQIQHLQKEQNIAVILVSHSMEDVGRYVNRIVAMADGRIQFDGTPENVFSHGEELRKMGLGVPQVTELGEKLRQLGWNLPEVVLTLDQMETALLREIRG